MYIRAEFQNHAPSFSYGQALSCSPLPLRHVELPFLQCTQLLQWEEER